MPIRLMATCSLMKAAIDSPKIMTSPFKFGSAPNDPSGSQRPGQCFDGAGTPLSSFPGEAGDDVAGSVYLWVGLRGNGNAEKGAKRPSLRPIDRRGVAPAAPAVYFVVMCVEHWAIAWSLSSEPPRCSRPRWRRPSPYGGGGQDRRTAVSAEVPRARACARRSWRRRSEPGLGTAQRDKIFAQGSPRRVPSRKGASASRRSTQSLAASAASRGSAVPQREPHRITLGMGVDLDHVVAGAKPDLIERRFSDSVPVRRSPRRSFSGSCCPQARVPR